MIGKDTKNLKCFGFCFSNNKNPPQKPNSSWGGGGLSPIY